jgi:hypothetical protein
VLWTTPAPSGVDEELAIFHDGVGLLAVRTSRSLGHSIGTYRCVVGAEDLDALSVAGITTIDLLAPRGADGAGALADRADRLAFAALDDPQAVASFQAGVAPDPGGGPLSVALFVLAAGRRAVEFELDATSLAVEFLADGQPIGWQPLPSPSIGFVTAAAAGLGGLGTRAVVEPGTYGTILFDVPSPAGTTGIALRVAGWLSEALPDSTQPTRFTARTAEVPLVAD